jgi:hypothetical protein
LHVADHTKPCRNCTILDVQHDRRRKFLHPLYIRMNMMQFDYRDPHLIRLVTGRVRGSS